MISSDSRRRYVVISADNHAGADLLAYKPYLEERWHEEFDAWAIQYSNPWEFTDSRFAESEEEGADGNTTLFAASSWHSPLNWDSARRQQHMNESGVVAEVIFPNTAPPFMPSSVLAGAPPTSRDEYERRWAGLRAHNRWLLDFCAEVPGQRAGVAQVMLYDIEDAVSEVADLKAAGLTGGILLPMDGTDGGSQPLYRPEYEPLWAVCEDLGVPVHRHGSTPPVQPDEKHPEIVAIGMAEYAFYNHRALTHLTLGGVFERHPNLTFVMSELGIDWVPSHLAKLDGVYRMGKARLQGGFGEIVADAMAPLTMSPSGYFKRNCYLGASLLSPAEVKNYRYEVGVDRVMWGIDYPHAEGSFPYSREALRLTFEAVPEPEIRMMLSETAARIYQFDLNYLQEVANQFGPTVEEVAEPLREIPRVPEDTYAKVFDRREAAMSASFAEVQSTSG